MDLTQVISTVAIMFVVGVLLMLLSEPARLVWRLLPDWLRLTMLAVLAVASVAWFSARF